MESAGLFLLLFAFLLCTHASLLRLPYFWDEAGYYIPATRDLLAGSLIPTSTPSNAHPPLVMAYLALMWKAFGEHVPVTRCAMLALAAFSLLGFFRLSRTVSNVTVALAATFLVAIYPVFFSQSSLAQVDLPAAGLTFWGLENYLRRHRAAAAVWFSFAALGKETAIVVPVALCAWEVLRFFRKKTHIGDQGRFGQAASSVLALIMPALPLALWYGYHYSRTGFVFGNPEFLRYNLQANLTPLRVVLAFLLRVWQTVGYLNLFLLTLACIVAMRYPPQTQLSDRSNTDREDAGTERNTPRGRIDPSVQFAFLSITVIYLLAMSVLGGAVLARYMLPVVPLVILICVSTIWRRLRFWKAVLVIIALSFLAALIINPPYGFSPEDSLAYADYIRMHQRAEEFIQAQFPHARVLTAWPATDELSRPYLGYVHTPVRVVRIEDFTPEQLMSAVDAHQTFDLALVFSTKYRPPRSFLDHWQRWREWNTRFFAYHEDMTPAAAAPVLGGNLVYSDSRQGQWVGVVQVQEIQEATLSY